MIRNLIIKIGLKKRADLRPQTVGVSQRVYGLLLTTGTA